MATTSIDTTHYASLVTEAQASSRVLLDLKGQSVLFYTTTTTHELRARAYESDRIYTLMQGVKFAHGFVADGVACIYAVLVTGEVKLVSYRYFGDPAPLVTDLVLGGHVSYLHASSQHGWNFLTTSDGGRIYLLAAKDPAFSQKATRVLLYANSRDPLVYVDYPVAGVHPDDYHPGPRSSRITIGVQRTTLATGIQEVGYFLHEMVLD